MLVDPLGGESVMSVLHVQMLVASQSSTCWAWGGGYRGPPLCQKGRRRE